MAEPDLQALLDAEHAVGEVLLGVRDGTEAFRGGMGATAAGLGWRTASLWVPGTDGVLRIVLDWAVAGARSPAARIGAGPPRPGSGPAAAWAAVGPRWFADPAADPDVVQGATLAAAGVRAGVWFPLQAPRGPVALVEAHFHHPVTPDPRLEAVVMSLGRRVGQFVQHTRADRRSAAARERKQAILDAALDCIITIDAAGVIVEANAALQSVFGIAPEAAVGREMAELLVPPELRDAHRAGLQRLVAGGEPRLLGRRVRLEALTPEGERVPVELAITRIDVPGAPLFTGHVRDITAARDAELALRASRARVVEAADAARRRIERDLHDGAQQGLVALALTLRLADGKLESDPALAHELLAEAQEELGRATAELRELARGIHPAVLTEAGLGAAVAGLVRRSAIPATAQVTITERLPAAVEAAVYFTLAEALANAARHSGASRVVVTADRDAEAVRFGVVDDGGGGASLEGGSGLRGLVDRLAAVDGRLVVTSPPGGGTAVQGVVPLGPAAA